MDESTKSKEKHGLGKVHRVPAVASITDAQNISQPIYFKAGSLNVQLKSRMRENFTYVL